MEKPTHKRYASTSGERTTPAPSFGDYIQLKEQNLYLKTCLEAVKLQKVYTKECALIEDNLHLKTELDNVKNKLNSTEDLLRKARHMLTNIQEEVMINNTLLFRKQHTDENRYAF